MPGATGDFSIGPEIPGGGVDSPVRPIIGRLPFECQPGGRMFSNAFLDLPGGKPK
jgi:hypothetical protein